MTSFLETVTPAWVAKWNPTSLKASRTRETAEAPYASTSAATMPLTSRFFSERLTNSNFSWSQSSSSASASARSIRSLKMIRPTVVRKCSSSARPELGEVVELDQIVLVGQLSLLGGAERVRTRPVRLLVPLAGFSASSSSASSSPVRP